MCSKLCGGIVWPKVLYTFLLCTNKQTNNAVYEQTTKAKGQMRCSKIPALARIWCDPCYTRCYRSSRSFTEIAYITVFKYPQIKKSSGFKSSKLTGHDTGSHLPTHICPKVLCKCSPTAIEKCTGTPSW